MKEVSTYLTFDGNCRDAMTFYEKCLGAELQLVPFSEAPDMGSKVDQNRIMHARLSKGSASILMASDAMPGTPLQVGSNFSICLACESLEEIERLFKALGDKGKVTMPLQDTFWNAHFGMLTDQFGVNWMFNLDKPPSA